MNRPIIFVLIVIVFAGCAGRTAVTRPVQAGDVPRAEREFRGVWVATVGNIDWPSKQGLTTDEQKQEALAILDTIVALNMNAVVFQVRPHSDAIYQSAIEPWSHYLSGIQGKAPDPYYDPLQFWIDESHKRGLELHAWFNPYRAHLTRTGEIPESSIVRRRPDLAKKINDGMYWLDPSQQETQDLSYSVVMDVVKRYDVDGIHFDDYFYPYNDGQFPDEESWSEFRKKDTITTREDWRRSHVNTFIERVYNGIKKEKKHVKFGLSPFGIWRPKNPPSIAGYDQYNMLYADAKLWLNKGWIDYWTPQLYWPVNQIPQSFPVLLGWWVKENTMQRNLWPGMIISRTRDEKGADEIFNQIMIVRGFVPDGPGHVHFSMKAFQRDSSVLNSILKNGPYSRPALVPSSPWLDNTPPEVPTVTASRAGDSVLVTWTNKNTEDIFRSVIYFRYNAAWEYTIVPSGVVSMSLPVTRTVRRENRRRNGDTAVSETIESLQSVGISAVDRTGNESPVAVSAIVSDQPLQPSQEDVQ